MEFNSLAALEKYLQEQINDSLDKEMAEQVKEDISLAVLMDVYGAGTPKRYERRAEEAMGGGMDKAKGTGSLSDPSEMEHEVDKENNTLTVENLATFNDDFNRRKAFGNDQIDKSKSLAENIHYGYGARDEWWNESRSFMDTASKFSETNLVGTMEDALVKRLGRNNVRRG